MSNLWRTVKLGSLCSVVTKGTTPTSVGMDFTSEGIPFLRITDIQNGHLSLDDVLYVSKETHDALKRSKIRPGDLLITIAGTIGKITIVPRDFPESNCNQALAIVRFDEEKLFPRFLLHWLNSPEAHRQIRGKKVTATISNLSLGQIKELEIPLPPMPEQKRIAAILDKADQLRQKRQQAIDLTDEFLRSVFLDMFGDPVTNPKGWEKKELESICLKVIDCPHSTPKWTETGIIGLRTSNLTKGGWKWDDTRYVSAETYDARTRRAELQANDIILSREGTVGIAALVPENVKMCMGQRLVQLRVDVDYVLPEYMLFLLLYELEPERISRVMAGSTSKHLNVKDLKKLLIMLPPIEKQRAFVSAYLQKVKMDKLFDLALDEKTLTFNSLSQKAFAGEL